jgi:hypothetical protein
MLGPLHLGGPQSSHHYSLGTLGRLVHSTGQVDTPLSTQRWTTPRHDRTCSAPTHTTRSQYRHKHIVYDAGNAGTGTHRPAVQFVHMLWPPALKRPLGHIVPVAASAPSPHSAPGSAKQGPLQAGEVKPAVAPKVSAGHRVHANAAPVEYRPGGHATHCGMPGPAAYRPAGQGAHIDAFQVAAKRPGRQGAPTALVAAQPQ